MVERFLQWPLSLPFQDHPSLLSSGCWQMLLLLLVWLPRAWEFHWGSLDEGREACCLAVILLCSLQRLFVVDLHEAVNNWPSLFLWKTLLAQIISAESLQSSLSINWFISSKGILFFPWFHCIFCVSSGAKRNQFFDQVASFKSSFLV